MRTTAVIATIILAGSIGFGATVNQIGSYANWATDWAAIGGYDADNGAVEYLDFVGNASNPGLYYANQGGYLFFRMRIDADTFASSTGTHLLLLDVANYGVTGIDYGFAWDAFSANNSRHGLEMMIRSVNGPTWGVSQVDDLDGSNGQKLVNDINGDGRTTDGYVRSIDGQSTVNFGNTTFIDFAVAWSYLETYTDLCSNQVWRVGLASINNATDHNAFNADVSGANLTDSISVGWSSPVAVPEPVSVLLIGSVAAVGLFIRRRFCD
jgi:hypothetical protein